MHSENEVNKTKSHSYEDKKYPEWPEKNLKHIRYIFVSVEQTEKRAVENPIRVPPENIRKDSGKPRGRPVFSQGKQRYRECTHV